jgi:hypothetical protein
MENEMRSRMKNEREQNGLEVGLIGKAPVLRGQSPEFKL